MSTAVFGDDVLYLIVMIAADGLQECELCITQSSVICLAFEIFSLINCVVNRSSQLVAFRPQRLPDCPQEYRFRLVV